MMTQHTDEIQKSDDMVQMFFDPNFDPQNYLNLLLSTNTVQHKLGQQQQQQQQQQHLNSIQSLRSLQPMANTLISKFDFYTTNLTKEFERNVTALQDPISDMLVSGSKKAKLEFYLDTLTNSVYSLEGEISSLERKLEENRQKHGGGVKDQELFLENLQSLKTIKSRLQSVLNCFTSINKVVNPRGLHEVTVEDFKRNLAEQHDSIVTGLRTLMAKVDDQEETEENKAFIENVHHLVNLKQIFKNFELFHPIYMEFAQSLKNELNQYDSGNPTRE